MKTQTDPLLGTDAGADERWWESFYDEAAMMVLADQDPADVRCQVDVIADLCGLSRGDRVMDQCCGLGQHAIELASRGIQVTGIDQSNQYVAAARRRAANAEVRAKFVAADALHHVHATGVDAVINWHSSFGYLPTDGGNARMLECAQMSLVPSGHFLLEFANMRHLVANFKPVITSSLADDVELTRHSHIQPLDGTIRQTWTYRWTDGTVRRHHSRLRIYMPDQLEAMVTRAGFAGVQLFSGEGKRLTDDDPRCIVIGHRKPGS